MRAWKWNSVGGEPELITLEKETNLQQNEVRVDLSFSSLNHRDVWIMEGKYPNIKLPCTLGSDGSGYWNGQKVILNPGMFWGENEKAQSPAFQILGMPRNGTFAENVIVFQNQIYTVPEHLSLEEAAAIPLAGVTAYRTLMTKGCAKRGQKVLITGIGGGVALWALKFALSISCEVYVTSSSHIKIEQAKALGAAGGMNTTTTSWEKTLHQQAGEFDLIIDSIMGNTLPLLIKLCKPGGKICFYGASAGNSDNFSPHAVFWKQIDLSGSTMGSDQDFKNMIHHINEYKIRPVIDTIFPFSKLPDAIFRMKDRQQFGKIILKHDE